MTSDAHAASPPRPRGLGERLGGLTPSGQARVPIAWALYDFANTIYSYAVVSLAMGLWTVDRLGPGDGQFWFGVANAVSVGINALVSPVLGAMSDRGGRRLPFLLFFTAQCVIFVSAIGLLGSGTSFAFLGLAFFTIANFSYQAALIYYDATLPTVSLPASRGRVSGIGVAIGYVGTITIAVLILLLGALEIIESGSQPLVFFLAAGLFAVFSVPIFTIVRERQTSAYRFSVADAIGSWAQLGTTLRHARAVPGMLRFLVGRFFYTDPVNTVIVVMAVFATEAIGLSDLQANLVLLSLTIVAVFASFGWGVSVERFGPKRTLMVVLGTWCLGIVIAGSVLSLATFLVAGALLGSGLGGVWTSDRVLMLRLSPPERVGEFFGLYGLAGKFSAVTGPVLYGFIVRTLLDAGWGDAAYQVGIFSFLILMIIGVLFLRGVREPPPEAAAAPPAAPPEHLLPLADMPGPARH